MLMGKVTVVGSIGVMPPKQHWLVKSEPEEWSWQDQLTRGEAGEIWSGVRNHQAANHLKAMLPGDQVLFYHSGKRREIVGIAEVTKAAYPDPTDETGKFVAVTIKAVKTLKKPVSLAEIKSDNQLAEMPLVKQSRLSVMPIAANYWQILMKKAS